MLEHVILGAVQGLTEFLPVSSSAHLAIGQKLFNLAPDLAFDIVVHLATLFAVVIYFWKELISLISGFLKALLSLFLFKKSFNGLYKEEPMFKLGLLLLLSFFVTAVVGLVFSDFFESLFSNIKYVGMFLLLTALIIILAEKYSKPKKDIKILSFWDSIVIGLAQSAAIAPGLSRSGTTVSAGLLLGLNRELAAKYSFLLSIPTIFAAGIFEAKKVFAAGSTSLGFASMLAGALSAFITGLLAIYLFMSVIKKSSLNWFAYYCIIVGLLTLILL